MLTTGIKKSKPYTLTEIIEYIPNSVVRKTIVSKKTGIISIVAVDTDESLSEKISPFDTFIYVIEGTAEVVISSESSKLQTGQGIIIPAHASNAIKGNGRFKMISIVIKSGYDEALI
ncbi:MAG: hypothetical protein PHE03_06355 [Bacteroidales bacterium]|nr:hypothetical protein [Bacteroidales bacterium]MDD3891909.1 hypothetical protein [Bacteroidales bacterium]